MRKEMLSNYFQDAVSVGRQEVALPLLTNKVRARVIKWEGDRRQEVALPQLTSKVCARVIKREGDGRRDCD